MREVNIAEKSRDTNRHIYGIDFSGAKDAGKKIWIARGIAEGRKLRIEDCCQASSLPGAGNDRDSCLAALRDFIAREKNSIFGADFPFGLPNKVIQELFKVGTWAEFVRDFYETFSGPKDFRKTCWKAANSSELKRVTDKCSKTPFSPYNLRVCYQTYYGIHDILYPLVSAGRARVLPMQGVESGKTIIIEICPASTLKQLEKRPSGKNLYKTYKGRGEEYRNQRLQIVDALMKTSLISIPDSIRTTALNDTGGDALDSIIAAYSTFCASCKHFAVEDKKDCEKDYEKDYHLEGYVFA
ncbi:Uncharacterised protein [uncultured archaeon]|nr:Uncharacterised protein [uncultured archaeon]